MHLTTTQQHTSPARAPSVLGYVECDLEFRGHLMTTMSELSFIYLQASSN